MMSKKPTTAASRPSPSLGACKPGILHNHLSYVIHGMDNITRDAHKKYFDRIIRDSVYGVSREIEKQQFSSSKTITIIVFIDIGRWGSCFM